jgi:hypothetical protein
VFNRNHRYPGSQAHTHRHSLVGLSCRSILRQPITRQASASRAGNGGKRLQKNARATRFQGRRGFREGKLGDNSWLPSAPSNFPDKLKQARRQFLSRIVFSEVSTNLFSGEPPSKRFILHSELWHLAHFWHPHAVLNRELKGCSPPLSRTKFHGTCAFWNCSTFCHQLPFDAFAHERAGCCRYRDLRL